MLPAHCPEGMNKGPNVGFWTKKTFSLFIKTSLISNRSTDENCVRSLVATFVLPWPKKNGHLDGAFVNTSWDRSTRHRAHPKRNALGGKVLAGTFLSHMAGRSSPFHSPVRFLFVSFPSHGKSADLCSDS